MKTGCPMLIIAPPKEFTKLKRLESIDLSKEAERELLNFNYKPFTVSELQILVNDWIKEYENNRPHESLGMLTPKQFEDKFNKEHLLCRTKVYLALHSIRDYDVS